MLRAEKGYSLIEITIVIAIIGVLVGAIWIAAATVIHNHKTNTLISQITQIIQNTRSMYASMGKPNATGFTDVQAVSAGLIPSEMIWVYPGVVDEVRSPFFPNGSGSETWNGDVRMGAVTANQIEMTIGLYSNIPFDTCTRILTILGSQSSLRQSGIVWLSTGASGGDITNGGTVTVTPAMAAKNCTSNFPGIPGTLSSVAIYFNIS